MRRKTMIALIVLIISLCLSGCWDETDISNRAIVMTVGVDKQGDMVRLLMEVQPVHGQKKEETSTESKQGESVLIIGEGKTLIEAQNSYHLQSPDDPYIGGVRALVFSDRYATEEGLLEYVSRLRGIREYRKIVHVFTTTASIDELLNSEGLKIRNVGFNIEHMADSLQANGLDLNLKVTDIAQSLDVANTGFFIDNLDIVNGKIERTGYSIFLDGKKIGFIPEEKITGINLLVVDNANPGYSLYYKGINLDFSVELLKRSIKATYYQDGAIQFDVKLSLDGHIISVTQPKKLDDESLDELGALLSEKIKQDIEDAIKTSQQKFKCDYLYFYKYFRSRYFSEFKELNWNKAYETAKFNVDVTTNVFVNNMVDME